MVQDMDALSFIGSVRQFTLDARFGHIRPYAQSRVSELPACILRDTESAAGSIATHWSKRAPDTLSSIQLRASRHRGGIQLRVTGEAPFSFASDRRSSIQVRVTGEGEMSSAEGRDDGEVKLLNFWASPYGMRAVLALAAKGVPYTTIPQELGAHNRSPLLLQSNPVHKKVPVLLHKGKAICESLIICEYVDEAFPHSAHALLPSDPYLRVSARFWADFCDKKIFTTFFKPMAAPKEEFKSAMEECKGYFKILEDAFTTEGPFFGGSKVGFVDIVMGPIVACLPAVQTVASYEWQFDKLPQLQKWIKYFSECPLALCLPDKEKVSEVAKIIRQSRFPEDP